MIAPAKSISNPSTGPNRTFAVTEQASSMLDKAANRAARNTPPTLARRVRGLSDRAIAWLFISPTIVLLLAINIFPLIWTIQLSFTNYRANRPNAEIENVGLAAFSEDTLDQPLDGGEPPGAKAEFQAVRIRIGIFSGAGIFVRCVCARESVVHLIAPIIG